MKKILSLLALLFLVSTPFAAQTFTTANVDDYTNSKNGNPSKTYNFTLDGTSMNAVGSNTSSTNMTWSQWLNVNADGFNSLGLGVVSSGGLTTKGITTYTIKYSSKKGTTYNEVFNDDLVPSSTAVKLPSPSRTGYTFNGWYTAASGGTKAGAANANYTPTSSTTLYGQWTANDLVWADKTYSKNYSTSEQTITLDKPTNGTTYGVTYSATTAGPLSVTSDGVLKIAAGTTAGKYQINVTATDKESAKAVTKKMTVYVAPTVVNSTINVSYGEKKFNVEMKGVSDSIVSATSGSGTLVRDGNYYIVTLNSAFTGTSLSVTYRLRVVDRDYDYTVTLSKTPKILKVNDAFTIFNNANQTPDFYDENEVCETINAGGVSDCIDYYKNQNDLFTWEISGNGLTSSQTAKNVYYNSGRLYYYTLKVKVKPNSTAPIAIFDPNNASGVQEKTVHFTIEPYKLASANTRIVYPNQTYGKIGKPSVYTTINGTEIKLVENQDYDIKTPLSQDMSIGAYNLKISGKNNYINTLEQSFSVTTKNITDSDVSIGTIKDQPWTGSAITPGVSITYNGKTLTPGTDFTLSYSNNTNIGTATITITGKGNFAGTKTINFKIVPNKFDQFVIISNGQANYTGSATNGGASVSLSPNLQPKTTPTIKYGTASGTYNLTSIPTYTNAGTYTVYFKITGSGYSDYTGSLKIVINKVNNSFEIKDSANKVVNSAKLIVPTGASFKFTLKFDTTVTASSTNFVNVSIDNNANTITLTPIKAGTEDITFTAAAIGNNVNAASAVLSVKVLNGVIKDNSVNVEGVYKGSAYTFNASYTPSDAKVEYLNKNNSQTNVGVYVVNYKITKVGYDDLMGSRTITITPKEIASGWVTLEYTSREYTGQALKPKVTVKDGSTTLVENKDYLLEYNNNILPTNNATVTVTGIGNYQGTVKKTFTITAKNMQVTTNSYETEYTSFETNGSKAQRDNAVKVVIAGDSNVTYCTTDPDSLQRMGNCTDENNFSVSIPKFKKVGTHIVKVKVNSVGYNTVYTEFTIKINKKLLPIPKVSEPSGYLYTGIIQEPSWIGYNSLFTDKKGKTRATEPGTYTEKFVLKDKVNTAWLLENGTQTTDDQTQNWQIIKQSIKDHESIVNNYIKYNEWKQVAVEDGKLAFDRTGYVQTGWVEDCVDKPSTIDGMYDRECSYNKYTALTTGTYTTKASCETAGNIWYSNKCFDKRNLYDLGASISGAFVAERTNSCETINDFSSVHDEYNSLEACEAKGFTWWNNLCYETSAKVKDPNKADSYDLFAVWSKITYRINYELCDGLGCGAFKNSITTIASYDQYFTVPNPERIGYIFAGWTITGMDDTPHVINGVTTTDVEYTVPKEWVQNSVPSYKNLTSLENATVTMTANWEPIEYTLVYDRNKSTYKENAYTTLANAPVTTAEVGGTMSNQRMSYDNPVAIIPNQFWMQGYTFNGWSTSPNGKTSSGAVCTVYRHDLEDPYQYVKKDNSQCLTFTNSFMAQTGGKNLIQNLTIVNQDVITMYAQWTQNTNTTFQVQYYIQKIGVGSGYNSTNYSLAFTETYTGLTDGMVTVQPYWYGSVNAIPDNMSTSALSGTSLNNTSPSDNANKQSVKAATKNSSSDNINSFTISGNKVTNNNAFRGFTLQYPQTVESATSNNQITDGYHTKKAGTYTYVIKPDGKTIIKVYYTRNTYNITINTRQIDSVNNDGNPNTRQYQISTTLQNPLNISSTNGSLVNNGTDKTKDAGYKSGTGVGSTNNTGLANFQAWYYNNSLTNQITYIGGEVSKPETIWAKWYQYRYTGSGSTAWEYWGKMDE